MDYAFVIIWLFPGKVMSQTNTPLVIKRPGYQIGSTCGFYGQTHTALPVEYYPWGICLRGNTSRLEDTWIEYAINKWNEDCEPID